MWRTYKGMFGKKRKRTGQNFALKLGIAEKTLAVKAGEHFFPQPIHATTASDTRSNAPRVGTGVLR